MIFSKEPTIISELHVYLIADIAYEKRRHAEDVLEYRRSLYKVFGDKTKVSWGLGKGIKAGHKQWNWDVDTGEC